MAQGLGRHAFLRGIQVDVHASTMRRWLLIYAPLPVVSILIYGLPVGMHQIFFAVTPPMRQKHEFLFHPMVLRIPVFPDRRYLGFLSEYSVHSQNGITAALGCDSLHDGYRSDNFDPIKWKTFENRTDRESMVEDLLENRELYRMTKSSVLELLGPPDPANFKYGTGNAMNYIIGWCGSNHRMMLLISNNNRVDRIEIYCD
jgi:hypothetical protein